MLKVVWYEFLLLLGLLDVVKLLNCEKLVGTAVETTLLLLLVIIFSEMELVRSRKSLEMDIELTTSMLEDSSDVML